MGIEHNLLGKEQILFEDGIKQEYYHRKNGCDKAEKGDKESL